MSTIRGIIPIIRYQSVEKQSNPYNINNYQMIQYVKINQNELLVQKQPQQQDHHSLYSNKYKTIQFPQMLKYNQSIQTSIQNQQNEIEKQNEQWYDKIERYPKQKIVKVQQLLDKNNQNQMRKSYDHYQKSRKISQDQNLYEKRLINLQLSEQKVQSFINQQENQLKNDVSRYQNNTVLYNLNLQDQINLKRYDNNVKSDKQDFQESQLFSNYGRNLHMNNQNQHNKQLSNQSLKGLNLQKKSNLLNLDDNYFNYNSQPSIYTEDVFCQEFSFKENQQSSEIAQSPHFQEGSSMIQQNHQKQDHKLLLEKQEQFILKDIDSRSKYQFSSQVIRDICEASKKIGQYVPHNISQEHRQDIYDKSNQQEFLQKIEFVQSQNDKDNQISFNSHDIQQQNDNNNKQNQPLQTNQNMALSQNNHIKLSNYFNQEESFQKNDDLMKLSDLQVDMEIVPQNNIQIQEAFKKLDNSQISQIDIFFQQNSKINNIYSQKESLIDDSNNIQYPQLKDIIQQSPLNDDRLIQSIKQKSNQSKLSYHTQVIFSLPSNQQQNQNEIKLNEIKQNEIQQIELIKKLSDEFGQELIKVPDPDETTEIPKIIKKIAEKKNLQLDESQIEQKKNLIQIIFNWFRLTPKLIKLDQMTLVTPSNQKERQKSLKNQNQKNKKLEQLLICLVLIPMIISMVLFFIKK